MPIPKLGTRFKYARKFWMVVIQEGRPLDTIYEKAELSRKLNEVPAEAIYWCRAEGNTDGLSRPHPFARIGNMWYSLLGTQWGKRGKAATRVYKAQKTFVWRRQVDGKPESQEHRLTYLLGRLARQHYVLAQDTGAPEPHESDTPFHLLTHKEYQLCNMPERLETAIQAVYPHTDSATYLRGALDAFRCFFDLKHVGVIPQDTEVTEATPVVKDVECNPLLRRIYPGRYRPY